MRKTFSICPFCKSDDIRRNALHTAPYCHNCLAMGPLTGEDVTAQWDDRPIEDELRAEIKELRAALENSHLGELIFRVKVKIRRVARWLKNHECI